MDERPDKQLIADLVAGIGAGDLAARLTSRCWPGGGSDRRNVIASEWLRRWQPTRAILALPPCGCRTGRCEACN